MALYFGINLHSNNSVVSLINDNDQLICELSLQSMISRHTGLRLSSHQVKQLKHEKLAHYFEADATLFAAQQTHQLMQQLKLQIETIEDFVLARCEESEQYSRITSTPGIGKILGMTILFEIVPHRTLCTGPDG